MIANKARPSPRAGAAVAWPPFMTKTVVLTVVRVRVTLSKLTAPCLVAATKVGGAALSGVERELTVHGSRAR